VFIGPDGNRCEVVRGDALGNRGARVAAITQYKVIIDVPGEEKTIERSLVPPLKGFGESDEESDDADDDEELDDRESALADANWMSRGFNHCGLSLSAGKPALNASRQSLPSRP
jgi:hypothetical protein